MIHFWLSVLAVGMLGVFGLAFVNTACSVVAHSVIDGDRDPRQYLQALAASLIGLVLLVPGAYAGYVLFFVPFCKG